MAVLRSPLPTDVTLITYNFYVTPSETTPSLLTNVAALCSEFDADGLVEKS